MHEDHRHKCRSMRQALFGGMLSVCGCLRPVFCLACTSLPMCNYLRDRDSCTGTVFRHYHKSMAKSAGNGFRDGAVVPFE